MVEVIQPFVGRNRGRALEARQGLVRSCRAPPAPVPACSTSRRHRDAGQALSRTRFCAAAGSADGALSARGPLTKPGSRMGGRPEPGNRCLARRHSRDGWQPARAGFGVDCRRARDRRPRAGVARSQMTALSSSAPRGQHDADDERSALREPRLRRLRGVNRQGFEAPEAMTPAGLHSGTTRRTDDVAAHRTSAPRQYTEPGLASGRARDRHLDTHAGLRADRTTRRAAPEYQRRPPDRPRAAAHPFPTDRRRRGRSHSMR